MAASTADFLQDYQALARDAWDAWVRQMPGPAAVADPLQRATSPAAAGETLERALDGVRGYMGWLQGLAATGLAADGDWQRQLPQWFGGANSPFSQAFAGVDGLGTQGFMQQWQSWMQGAQGGGLASGLAAAGPVPTFGLDREQQMQQQELAQALLVAAQATARYQALLQRAATEGVRRLQDKLAQHAEPGRQIDSLKGLYDLWVDAAEEAYAEMALTEEFRATYGAMVNAQMHVRQLQQKHVEAMCQQLGMPTRSEVSSLGKRVQALRREMRAMDAAAGSSVLAQVEALRKELAAMQGRAAKPAASAAADHRRPARSSAVAKRSGARTAVARPVTRSKQVAAKRPGARTTAAKTKPAKSPASKVAKSPRRPAGKRK